MVSITLKSGSSSTMYNPMLAPKVMYMHTKFEEPSFILSQDIVQKHQDKSVTDRRTEKAKPVSPLEKGRHNTTKKRSDYENVGKEQGWLENAGLVFTGKFRTDIYS